MTFDDLVDRLTSLYDVTETRAAEVANQRLQRMIAKSKALRAIKSLGTTVADQASYSLSATVVQILNAKATYSDGQVNYTGDVTIDDLWNVDAGRGELDPCGAYIAVEYDDDSDINTSNFRIYPAPSEADVEITGLVALRPATITYGSSTALPIPEDLEEALLAGCKAELSKEDDRPDIAAGYEAEFASGVADLAGETKQRGVGAGGHRMRVSGYDFRRG